MGLDLFKLEKLKIKAFKTAKRTGSSSEFKAMFNPTSLKRSYGIEWSGAQGINSSSREARYQRTDPAELEVTLVLDGTGVHEMGPFLTARKTVEQRVKKFMDVAFRYDGDLHEPNYLLLEWGKLSFPCRLKTVDVTYDAFHRDGSPLRAELAVKLVADDEDDKRSRQEQQSSPDLTHTRVVRAGDTLPLLTRELYGSPEHYLGVARFNGLDDFRNLAPGRRLLFPPLGKLLG